MNTFSFRLNRALVGVALCASALLSTTYASVKIESFSLKPIEGESLSISLVELEQLPSAAATLTTNFFPSSTFKGVLWTDFQKKYPNAFVGGANVRFSCYDSYQGTISLKKLTECGAVLVYERNGKKMDIENNGPLGLIFPEGCSSLGRSRINADTFWQIKSISVEK